MKPKVLVIGASGMLGVSLSKYLENHTGDYVVYNHSNSQSGFYHADLRNSEKTEVFLDDIKPEIIINLSALTNVDLCENDKNEAYLLNVKIVENITRWLHCNKKSSLIQISTDHFYDSIHLSREKEITIKNTYAMTKYAGELACDLNRTTILRTNFLGRSLISSRVSFSDWIYKSLISKDKISAFSDVYFSPLVIDDLCKYIVVVMKNLDNKGVFNLGSIGSISKSDVCLRMGKALSLSCEHVSVIESKDALFLKTNRPMNMGMNCNHFMDTFNEKLPTIDETIGKLIKEYK